jgi:5,10-methylenetetrahydromethanopterin reductase
MPLGLVIDGMTGLETVIPLAQEAEKIGLNSLWIAEHFGHRDAFVIATSLIENTNSLEIIPGPISPYVRHPLITAMGIASLSERGPGRLGLVIGVGDIGTLHEWGIELVKPIGTMKQAILIIRTLLSGETVNLEGDRFILHGRKMEVSCEPPPIYIAAMGPQMLAVSGESADGVVLSAVISASFAKRSLDLAQAKLDLNLGREMEFKKIGWLLASAAQNTQDAYRSVKERLTYFFHSPHPMDEHTLDGVEVDYEGIKSAIAQQDWERGCSLVSDEVVEVCTVSGSPLQFQDRLQAYIDAGIDYPVLWLLGGNEEKKLAINLALEICG